jgi:epoxyqueuosine reductase QueG
MPKASTDSEDDKMKGQGIKSEISYLLHSEGISACGVAAVKKLPPGSEDFSPQILLEGARSIICYGVPIPKGIVYARSNNLDLYWRYCNMQYRTLDSVSNRLCLFLEEKHCSATPVYSCFPWKIVNRQFRGHVPLVYWAEEAGLGRLAKCGLLVTPQHGTRILLGAVIATQELEPDEKVKEDICPPNCFHCIDACPVKAIKGTGKVDHNLCIRHSSSNPLLALVLDNPQIRENYPFDKILNTVAVDDHGTYSCFECLRVCPLNIS